MADGAELKVAVVGSGPSGLFAADALLKSAAPRVHVDVIDRLPTPFGLVRLGVAPDHPKIKTITRTFEKIFVEHAARVAFLGNVTVGRDVEVKDLFRFYDAVIFAHGAENDRRLGVPGEDLKGSHTATEFVAWYNGHPDARDLRFDLSHEVAFVVGQGNVAMDVARVLSKTVDELRHTDIAAHALDALAESRVKEIHIIGRRGPAQVKFTPPEVKELGELQSCDPVVDASVLALDDASQKERDQGPESTKRILDILAQYAARPSRPSSTKRVKLRFLLSPTALEGDGRLTHVVLEKNRLAGEPFSLSARGTGETAKEACGILFRSVGYKGRPLAGLPFDEKSGTVPNEKGRVRGADGVVRGLYTAGWIKRGPSGVIGTNKPDAQDTVAQLLADSSTLPRAKERSPGALADALRARGVRVVSWQDWQRIDAAEIERGAGAGKPREKITRVDEMLRVLG